MIIASIKGFLGRLALGLTLVASALLLVTAQGSRAEEASKAEIVLQIGHRKAITAAAYSSDGTRFLTGSLDGTAILWDAATGRQLRSFQSDTGFVTGVAFSPDGKQVATCGKDEIAVWDLTTGQRGKVFHPKNVQGTLTFGTDGKHLLVEVPRLGHAGIAQAILFDTETGHFHTLAHGEPGTVTRDSIAARFSMDGKYILTGSDDNLAILWDTAKREKVRTFEGHEGAVKSVAFSPDGGRVATASADKKVILWNAATGKKLLTLEGHAAGVTFVAFSPDGARVASGDEDGRAILWDTTKGEKIRDWKMTGGSILTVQFRPVNDQLLAIGIQKADRYSWWIDVWDMKTGKAVETRRGPIEIIRSIALSPDGRYLLTGGVAGRVGLWDTRKGVKSASLLGHDLETKGVARILFLVIAASINNEVTQVAVSPDSRTGISADFNGMAVVWDLESGKKLQTCDQGFFVTSLGFSPDGQRFFAASATVGKQVGGTGEPGEVVAWEVKTGKRMFAFERKDEGSVRCLAVSGDGKQLLAGCKDGTVLVWDATTGKRLPELKAHEEEIVGLAFSADGKQLVTASRDKTVVLWHVKTRHKVRTFEGFKGSPTSIALSPKGEQVLVGSSSQEESVTLLDTRMGEKRLAFKGEIGGIDRVVFHPDGRLALTTSRDGLVRIWGISTGDEWVRLAGLETEDEWIVLSPRGFFDASPKSRDRVTYRLEQGLDVGPQPKRSHPGLLSEVWKGERPSTEPDK